MTYLVDANVLSEPTKPQPASQVVAWLRANEREIAINPMILGEVRFGILLLPPSAKRNRLEQWFSHGITLIQCLPWDETTGLRWAELVADLRKRGESMPIKDSLIAATALVHGLTVATRNTTDFRKTGAAVIDPFLLAP